MNFKSSLKYFSYSRNVGPGAVSESKQRQPESEDVARARRPGDRRSGAGRLGARVPVPVTRLCCAVPARGPGPACAGREAGRGAPGALLALPLWRGILTHKFSSNWSDGDNWVSCRCMQNKLKNSVDFIDSFLEGDAHYTCYAQEISGQSK